MLNRLLQHLRTELLARNDEAMWPGLRYPHLNILGNVGRRGVRLTVLAERSQMGLAACSELVNDLERLGYLARRPDPTDGRAKLILPTERGGELLDAAALATAGVDEDWKAAIGAAKFESAMTTLDQLLEVLEQRRHRPTRDNSSSNVT